jgi:hypothetical protein
MTGRAPLSGKGEHSLNDLNGDAADGHQNPGVGGAAFGVQPDAGFRQFRGFFVEAGKMECIHKKLSVDCVIRARLFKS